MSDAPELSIFVRQTVCTDAKRARLAQLSHELNTPMNGILGMTELALGTDLTDEQRVYLESVQRCALSLLGVVRGMLDTMGMEARVEPSGALEPSGAKVVTSVGSLTVLLVEDNKVNQVLAARMLERLGHTVALAENGREAIDLWRLRRFDLVLMDLQMPVMGGLEAVAAIRGEEASRGGHTPIVAVTADGPAWTRDELLERGMDELLPKPITQAGLCAVVSQVLASLREATDPHVGRAGLAPTERPA